MSARSTYDLGPNERIVCGGDSITQGNIPGGVWDWEHWLHAALNERLTTRVGCRCTVAAAPPASIQKVGAIGTPMASFDSTYAADAIALNPSLLFVEWGVNDAVNAVTPSATAASLISGVNKVWAALPSCRVCVLSVIAQGNGWPDGNVINPHDPQIDATNAAIAAACDTLALSGPLSYLDMRTWWFSILPTYNPGNLDTAILTFDSLHFNALGASLASYHVASLAVL